MPKRHSAVTSDRRRRLAISLSQTTAGDIASPAVALLPCEPELPPLSRIETPLSLPLAPVLEQKPAPQPLPVVEVASPPKIRRRGLPVTNPAFAPWLEEKSPATWVFAGDSLTHAGQRIARGGTFDGFLTRILRDHLERTRDLFINTASPGDRLEDVLRDVDSRILRFKPDVVILMCGPGELEAAGQTLVEFERMFQKLVRKLRDAGAAVIVNSPPAPAQRGNFIGSDRLIRLEALRGCTLESSALLVDHWEYWEHSAAADWYRSNGMTPADRGGVEMARHFVEELGLRPGTDASSLEESTSRIPRV